MLDLIFNEMELNKVGREVSSLNERAIKCHEKNCLKREGTLRQ